ncbi:MAG: hypothetical protein ACR65U_09390 [Methylocystis sp.]
MLRAADAFGRFGEERRYELADRFRALRGDANFAGVEVGREGERFARLHMRAIDPNPLQIIGEDDIVGEFAIALDLVGLENLVEIRPDFLNFDIAEDHAMARNLEIRRALVSLSLGFMLDPQAFVRILGDWPSSVSRAARPVCSVCSASGVSRSFKR